MPQGRGGPVVARLGVDDRIKTCVLISRHMGHQDTADMLCIEHDLSSPSESSAEVIKSLEVRIYFSVYSHASRVCH